MDAREVCEAVRTQLLWLGQRGRLPRDRRSTGALWCATALAERGFVAEASECQEAARVFDAADAQEAPSPCGAAHGALQCGWHLAARVARGGAGVLR